MQHVSPMFDYKRRHDSVARYVWEGRTGMGRSVVQTPGGGVLGLMFAGYVPLASQSPHSILVYFLANYRPHLSHFLENVIFAIPT